MMTVWNAIKGIFTVTGAYVWIKAIKETIEEHNEAPEK